MLRQRKRKMSKKKSQKGGLWPFGPVFGSHVSTAGEDAKKGWFHFTTGLKKGKEVGEQAKRDYTDAYQQRRSQSMGGMEPEPTTNVNPILREREQGRLATDVARQHQEVRVGDQSTANRNPRLEPVHTGHVRHSGNLTPRQIHFGGKRKTKKRRRKRKKKKTKRKKRRRKRKTKKRRRR